MNRFEGGVAVLTGAARGIGAATARRLVAEGANTVLPSDASFATGAELPVDGGWLVAEDSA
ncbi:short chain dehydrogenase [Actinopolyspora xinjiangensis]|uniref:Short chain dehydrogenase n=1 Tax=Actinopolyspora xinjiangensis TaxID=405564 RepID=A0A1H0NLJ7_9ACTN|nr:SDR family NAD(P)-dependent oxidoreductase [Actinopolyspora xinjiangensis]SDO93305.1 short chain dehydrogenase [Actinopolyspora xinjiangensis]